MRRRERKGVGEEQKEVLKLQRLLHFIHLSPSKKKKTRYEKQLIFPMLAL